MNTTRKGFALLDVAISLAIAGVLFGAIVQVNRSTLNTYTVTSARTLLQTQARRAIDRVSAELENAGLSTLQPDPVVTWTDNLVFQAATGVDAATGAITYGPPQRLSWNLESGENANGVDDNKNGLVDEGQLLLTRNYLQANQQSVVLAHRVAKLLEGEIANGADDNGNGLVDEHGFCAFREGNLLRIRLTLQRSLRPGQIIQATVETGVRLRN
jgi:Tfp pilus assembly protein PilW